MLEFNNDANENEKYEAMNNTVQNDLCGVWMRTSDEKNEVEMHLEKREENRK